MTAHLGVEPVREGSTLAPSRDRRFIEVYRSHSKDALRLAYLLTRDAAASEDIVQDAFLRLFRRFIDIRSERAVRAYLRRIVVNLSSDHFRRLKRHGDREARLRAELAPGEALPSEGTSIDLFEHVARLPPRQRAAAVLRYVEDLSEVETADILNTSVPAVKSLTARAIKELRRTTGMEQ